MSEQVFQYYCLDVVIEDNSTFIHHFLLVRAKTEQQARHLAREDWAKNGRSGTQITTIFTKPAPKGREVTFLVACKQEDQVTAPDAIPA